MQGLPAMAVRGAAPTGSAPDRAIVRLVTAPDPTAAAPLAVGPLALVVGNAPDGVAQAASGSGWSHTG